MFFGRIPRFHQVVVELNAVDRRDGRLGVGVGGEQDLAGFGEQLTGLLQELHAAHVRHALVAEQQGDGLVAAQELAQLLQGCRARGAPGEAVVAAVSAPHIALNGVEHCLVVVDDQDHRICHSISSITRPNSGDARPTGIGQFYSDCRSLRGKRCAGR